MKPRIKVEFHHERPLHYLAFVNDELHCMAMHEDEAIEGAWQSWRLGQLWRASQVKTGHTP